MHRLDRAQPLVVRLLPHLFREGAELGDVLEVLPGLLATRSEILLLFGQLGLDFCHNLSLAIVDELPNFVEGALHLGEVFITLTLQRELMAGDLGLSLQDHLLDLSSFGQVSIGCVSLVLCGLFDRADLMIPVRARQDALNTQHVLAFFAEALDRLAVLEAAGFDLGLRLLVPIGTIITHALVALPALALASRAFGVGRPPLKVQIV